MNEREIRTDLKENLKHLPEKPGVYIMKDEGGAVIYVGKAKNLSKRVRSYFTGNKSLKTRLLLRHLAGIETIITINEQEALLLENNLIKKWKPRYNINLKDGKSYPVIRLTNEDFPRVFRTRRIIFDGSEYFGPFASVNMIDIYLELIDRLFPLRKCRGKLKTRSHPCLNYYIGRCRAPCAGKISREDYLSMVDNVRNLLSGKTNRLVTSLKREMLGAASNLEFERAAKIRDSIEAIGLVSTEQNIVDFKDTPRDYIGYWSEAGLITFVVLQSRRGKLVGREIFNFSNIEDDGDALVQFVLQYYMSYHKNSVEFPRYIYIQGPVDEELIRSILQGAERTRIVVPKKGKHAQTVRLATENAREDVEAKIASYNPDTALQELKIALKLPNVPSRIEGFDIAHLGGEDTIASMVSFLDGLPDKSSYRHFKIRSLDGKIDDYESMREVIARRYSRVLNDNLEKPDLIIVDGGEGQVNAARAVLESLDLSDIPIMGLAKRNEEIFLPKMKEPIVLEKSSNALKLIVRVRDETHRFANRLHKHVRRKRRTTSILEGIPGVGKRRSRLLLETFGSVEGIIKSSANEIRRRTGISETLASSILSHLSQLHNRKT